ncbi:hypothetical protein HGA13_15635 [Nocardia speluncae]|uniref:TetR family transcriptional regulator n=1 Tax=Nocardia speluncae TaxID=419477 RepID=A0A846XIS6_9NOCA|nr:hypothetical protein [Nocardia speluncae]NKY34493.1 hypothetical protein [Nocardia speluncae]
MPGARRHDRSTCCSGRAPTCRDTLFRDLIEQGLLDGGLQTISVNTTLQCMHAAMSQAPLWCAELAPAEQQAAVDEITDTLMMMVAVAA